MGAGLVTKMRKRARDCVYIHPYLNFPPVRRGMASSNGSKRSSLHADLNHLRATFASVDPENTGYIGVQELRSLAQTSTGVDETTVALVLEKLDRDKDGKVSNGLRVECCRLCPTDSCGAFNQTFYFRSVFKIFKKFLNLKGSQLKGRDWRSLPAAWSLKTLILEVLILQ